MKTAVIFLCVLVALAFSIAEGQNENKYCGRRICRDSEYCYSPYPAYNSCLRYRLINQWCHQEKLYLCDEGLECVKTPKVGRMWSRTKHLFQKRPLLMNMVSFGTIYVGAEVAQQAMLLRTSKEPKSMDWVSVSRFAVVGIAGIAPVLFYWYKCLDFVLPTASRATVVKKVVADQLLAAPSVLVIFFTGMSVLERKEDIFAELKAKFWSTYKLSCCFWLPAQAINFALLPPYTRVAFVGVASFVWVNVLCLVKRQEFTGETVVEEEKELPNLLPSGKS